MPTYLAWRDCFKSGQKIKKHEEVNWNEKSTNSHIILFEIFVQTFNLYIITLYKINQIFMYLYILDYFLWGCGDEKINRRQIWCQTNGFRYLLNESIRQQQWEGSLGVVLGMAL